MKVKCGKCKQTTWEASFKEYLLAPLPRLCYKCMFNFDENEIASGKHETIVAVARYHVSNNRPLEKRITEYAEKYGYTLQNVSSVPLPSNAYAETHYIFTKRKSQVQVILDFSSLKDAMSQGGLVMSTYKCPQCSGMVDIPEAGKILVCKYCGSSIKPVDIFEKVKSLIQ